MSLIVGIRCTDSVVLAASGPGTMPSEDGLAPARQWARKLRVVGGKAMLAVSAHDGLAQEMGLSLERALAELDQVECAEDVLRAGIRDALAAPVQRTVAIHRTLQGLPGFGVSSNEYVLSQSMVAIPFQGSLRLYLLDPECSLTEITSELSYAAIGNVKAIADPFLAFLREVLWQDGLPGQAHGELAAYWTVRHAIENNPVGLTHPIQLIVMARRQDESIEIIERGDRELAAIGQMVDSSLRTVRKSLTPPPRGSASGSGKPPSGDVGKVARKRVPEVRLKLESPEQGRGPSRW